MCKHAPWLLGHAYRLQIAAVVLIVACLSSSLISAADCDVTLVSRAGDSKNGTFTSPGWPKPYTDNLHCTYRFIAQPNERVKVKFINFNVRGIPPRCLHDYVDVYTQVRTEDEDLLEIEVHGRYCGQDIHPNSNNLPHLLISMYHIFVIGFYTDNDKNATGFQGTYEFIDASTYNMGTPGPPKVCGYTVHSEFKETGFLMSPTYPGMYPDNLNCFYKLIGRPGQRIRLTFLDFDLFHGGDHCPFDSVEIFDGETNEFSVIGTYCGKHDKMMIYSSTEFLHIQFNTKSGRVPTTRSTYRLYDQLGTDFEVQRRGFKAKYEFSSDFVDLGFIKKSQKGTARYEHIRGTECDQRIYSEGESNGTVVSPNFPRNYPLNVSCRYYLDGLVNAQNLEQTKLKFKLLNIPSPADRCSNGHVSLYLNKRSIKNHHANRQFCGETPPGGIFTSADPRLLLIFNSTGRYSGKGFEAVYEFVTDYAIPGTPATTSSKCHFIYNSKSMKHGTFNSPRHPSNYPSNTHCQYDFIGLPRERVRITFESFIIEQEQDFENCTKDYLEVYNISPHIRRGTNATLIGRYCGNKFPGPIISEYDSHSLKIIFHSDATGIRSGFKAQYEFVHRKVKACIYNITSGYGGTITSPQSPHKYPRNHTCEWYIYAHDPGNAVMIHFPQFTLEGTLEAGCKGAVLKVYNADHKIADTELCGESIDKTPIVSTGNHLRLQFVSSSNAIGAKGFVISWTELFNTEILGNSSFCGGFLCKKSQFCISSNLQCNGVSNCGSDDRSDETSACPSKKDHSALHVILAVVLGMVLLILILVCIVHRRRRARKKKRKQQIEVRYVTRGHTNKPGEKLLLQERTEKVSIV